MHSPSLLQLVAAALYTQEVAAGSLMHQNKARIATSPVPTWNYNGCWSDYGSRQLSGKSYADDRMTPETCVAFCSSNNYNFAGVEYGKKCYCGYNLLSASSLKSDDDCNMSCAGNSLETCGGPNRLSVYTTNTPTVIVTNPGPVGSGWVVEDCYVDSVYSRTLSNRVDVAGPNTVVACTNACRAAGYKFAGVEWSSECYCDNQINNNAVGGQDNCDMVCAGNSLEYCGGSQRLNIYQYVGVQQSVTTSTTTTPMATSSSTTTSRASTTSSTTTTTTTIATAPTPAILQNFALRGRNSANPHANNQLLSFDRSSSFNPLFVAISQADNTPANFHLESGTNRLKAGDYYLIMDENDVSVIKLTAAQITGFTVVACTGPAVERQKLVCYGENTAQRLSSVQTIVSDYIQLKIVDASQNHPGYQSVDLIVEDFA